MTVNLSESMQTNYFENPLIELEDTIQLLNNLLQRTNDAIAAVDVELNILVINQSFIELFFNIYSEKVKIGMNLKTLLNDYPTSKTEMISACRQALMGKSTVVVVENENCFFKPYYCYEISVIPLYHEAYPKKELMLHIRNLTEYKLQERHKRKQLAEIELSCKLRSIGEMASALAHEVNQPLTAIMAYSQSCLFLLKNCQPDIFDKLHMPLTQISLQAGLAGEIIHNMKNFIRENNLKNEEININDLIHEILSILNYETTDFKLKITLNLDDTLPTIVVNKVHIMQVILNLLRNSIEAFQRSPVPDPEILIETRKFDKQVLVAVHDNGPGIPIEYKDRILNTYFTTKPHGTGIGLGISRTLIEEHGGKLKVLRHKTEGASFQFTLPMTEHAKQK